MTTPRVALQVLQNQIPSSGFRQAWLFVYSNFKLHRRYCQLEFLERCRREYVLPNFINNTLNIPFKCTKRIDTKLDKLKYEILDDVIRMKHSDIHVLKNDITSYRKELWSLNKQQYLLVKGLTNSVVSTERAISVKRLNSKFYRLTQRNVVTPQGSEFECVYKEVIDEAIRNERTHDMTTQIDVQLAPAEIQVLQKGPAFVPSSGKVSTADSVKAEMGVERAIFGLRWRMVMGQCEENNLEDNATTQPTDANDRWADDPKMIKLKKIRGKQPPEADRATETAFTLLKHNIMKEYSNTPPSNGNITRAEREALNELRQKDVVIKRSDKSKSLVAMKPETYVHKVNQHLKDPTSYVEVSTSAKDLEERVCALITKWQHEIPPDLIRHITPRGTRLPEFYGLPKIHKAGNPLRPVVAACDSPCTGISTIIERIINQLLQFVPSNLKNTDEILTDINNECPDGHCDNYIIVTMDVKALYPSIPIQEGITCVQEMLMEHINDIDTMGLSLTCIIDCLTFILNNNVFRFGHRTYRQISGVAMGNQVAPPLAIIFMNCLETRVIREASLKPRIFRRYVDDILFLWKHGLTNLALFIDSFQSAHPNIKFTYEDTATAHDSTISYMDLELSVRDSRLYYSMYEKPSDSGLCIPYTSSTPKAVKMAFIKSYFQRARKLSSNNDMYLRSVKKVLTKLTENGYPKQFIETARTMKSNKRRDKNYYKRIAIKLPYINDKLDKRVQRVVSRSKLPLRVVYNTQKHALQGVLTRSALMSLECPLQEEKRQIQERGGKRGRGRPRQCFTCGINNDTETEPICRKKEVVYQMFCAACDEDEDYIGETGREVSGRVDEHRLQAGSGTADTPWGKHWKSRHKGEQVRMRKMTILAREGDIINRKIREAIEIRDKKPTINISTGYRLL